MRARTSFDNPEPNNPATDHKVFWFWAPAVSGPGTIPEKHQMCLHSAIVPDEESTLAWATTIVYRNIWEFPKIGDPNFVP